MSNVCGVFLTTKSGMQLAEIYDNVSSAVDRISVVAKDIIANFSGIAQPKTPTRSIIVNGLSHYYWIHDNNTSLFLVELPLRTDISSSQEYLTHLFLDSIHNKHVANNHDDLPASWTYSGVPARMSDLKSDPHSLRDPEFLSDKEKWALVYARVAKQSSYTILIPNLGVLSQNQVLMKLKNKTNHGLYIRNIEIEYVSGVLQEALAG